MKKEWLTKDKDLIIAKQIIEQYATEKNSDALGLFEIIVNKEKKKMSFQLSPWVVRIAERFSHLYGAEQGNFITSRIISDCITNGQTIH